MRTAHTHRQQTMFLGASCGEASPEERSETAAESRLPPLAEDEDEISSRLEVSWLPLRLSAPLLAESPLAECTLTRLCSCSTYVSRLWHVAQFDSR